LRTENAEGKVQRNRQREKKRKIREIGRRGKRGALTALGERQEEEKKGDWPEEKKQGGGFKIMRPLILPEPGYYQRGPRRKKWVIFRKGGGAYQKKHCRKGQLLYAIPKGTKSLQKQNWGKERNDLGGTKGGF